jgi:hypothetical protein
MKNILKIIWDYLKKGNHMLVAVVAAIILILCAIVYFQHNKIVKLKDQYTTEVNLKNALLDSVHYYQNVHKEWVAERLTIQESIKNLEKMNGQLTASQKELLIRVKEVEKNSSIIAAALIETNVEIKKLRPPKVDVKDSSIVFSDSTKNLKYNIEIGHAKPINPGILPTLTFNKFSMPNKQFVEFHWKDEKKLGYPISFSVSNSNEYFKTVNIDSYAIPELKPEKSKFGQWMEKNGKIVTYVGIGVAAGVGGYYLVAH